MQRDWIELRTKRDEEDMNASAWRYYRQEPQRSRDLTHYREPLKSAIMDIREAESFEAYVHGPCELFSSWFREGPGISVNWCADPKGVAEILSSFLGLNVQVPPMKYSNKTKQGTAF